MNEFLNIALSFPTFPLSILVGFVFIYWLLACTGLVDSEGPEGWLDMDPDVGDLIEAGKGDGLAPASLAGLMSKLGLAAVPVMVSGSLVVLFMWAFTYYAHMFFLANAPAGVRWTLGVVIMLATFVLAVLTAAAALKPIRMLLLKFTHSTSEEKEVRGKEGSVISPVVDAVSGRIAVDDGGAGLVLSARSLSGEPIPRNSAVVVVSHDPEKDIYEVVSKEEFYKTK